MSHLYHYIGNPTIGVSTRPRVGLPPIGCKATHKPLQNCLRFHHIQEAVNRSDKMCDILTLLEMFL